jgi:hypothetical protein
MKLLNTKDLSTERFVCLIAGISGVGKTSLAKTLPPRETLVVSAESGLLCLQGTDIDALEVTATKDLYEVIEFAKKNVAKYKYIFLDSLTEIGEMVLRELKSEPQYQDPKNTLKMYGAYNDIMTFWIKGFRDFRPFSIIMTCLSENIKDGMVETEAFNLPGNSVRNSIKAWFDVVLQYKIFKLDDGASARKLVTDFECAPLAKDRSGKLDKYEEPDLQAIINKVLGVKK